VNAASFARPIVLAAIRGGPFPFMRIGAPVPGILRGSIFLREVIDWHTIAGSCIVVIGTASVTGFDPATLIARGLLRNA